MRIRFVDNVGATKTMGQMPINHASKHLKPCIDFPQSMRQIWRFITLKFPYIALVGATLVVARTLHSSLFIKIHSLKTFSF